MNFVGAAIPMQAGDIDDTAEALDIEPAALRAVLSVETGGSGFDKAGRPKALFERHYFYKMLKDKPDDLQLAVDAGIVKPLGFDDAFIRTWNYYFCYCEAGFATRHISVVQAIYTRANNETLDFSADLGRGVA